MPRISDAELARVCIRVWSEDYEYLRQVSRSQGTLGLNLLIRQIIHTYVISLKDQEQQQMDKIPNHGLDPLDPETLLGISDLAIELRDNQETQTEPPIFPGSPKGTVVEITL